MTQKRWLQAGAAVVIIVAAAFGVSQLLERGVAPVPEQVTTAAPPAPAPGVPHIIATLFYGTADGQTLAAVKPEVPLAERPRAQGRQILESDVEDPPAP